MDAAVLLREINAPSREQQVAFRDRERHVARLRRARAADVPPRGRSAVMRRT